MKKSSKLMRVCLELERELNIIQKEVLEKIGVKLTLMEAQRVYLKLNKGQTLLIGKCSNKHRVKKLK